MTILACSTPRPISTPTIQVLGQPKTSVEARARAIRSTYPFRPVGEMPNISTSFRRWDIDSSICRQFDPQFVLISAGFDAHVRDPARLWAACKSTEEGFGALAQVWCCGSPAITPRGVARPYWKAAMTSGLLKYPGACRKICPDGSWTKWAASHLLCRPSPTGSARCPRRAA